MIDLEFAIEVLPVLLDGLRITALASVGAMVLALGLGLVWALLQRSAPRGVARPVRWAVDFVRNTPLLVQLYLLFYVLPDFGLSLSPLATGIFGLGLHYSAYVSEIYRAGLDGIGRGQWEAATSLDLSALQTLRYVIVPQAIPPVIPALGNRFVALFKDTPLLSAITVVELLQSAKIVGAEQFRYLEPFTLVALLFLVLSLLAAAGVRWIETRWALRHE